MSDQQVARIIVDLSSAFGDRALVVALSQRSQAEGQPAETWALIVEGLRAKH